MIVLLMTMNEQPPYVNEYQSGPNDSRYCRRLSGVGTFCTSWLPDTRRSGMPRSSLPAIRRNSAVWASSPGRLTRSPQTTTNAGFNRFA